MPVNPLIELARTLVALRALAKDLGVNWEEVLETVTSLEQLDAECENRT